MVTLELPFPPSANKLWRRGKGRGMYLDPKYKSWKRDAGNAIIQARREGNARVWGRFTAHIVIDERRRRGNSDCDNRLKPVLDILQAMMVIDNDALADKVTVEWGEANGARVELVEVA